MKQLIDVLKKALQDLASVGAECAIVGGIAVGVRSEPRFTRDVDLAVSVLSDAEAERLVHALFARGYRLEFLLEQKSVKRIGTARLITPYHDGVFLDLLFASCGVEAEIVARADLVTVVRGLRAKVARRGHLIAMKLLSVKGDRPQDKVDLHELTKAATRQDWDDASSALVLIKTRGFARGRKLSSKLSALRGRSSPRGRRRLRSPRSRSGSTNHPASNSLSRRAGKRLPPPERALPGADRAGGRGDRLRVAVPQAPAAPTTRRTGSPAR